MKLQLSNIAFPLLLQKQIEVDESSDVNELIQRDREIGIENSSLKPKAQLLSWLNEVASDEVINFQKKFSKLDHHF